VSREGLLDKARNLGLEVSDTRTLIESLDKARDSLEAARRQLDIIIDEMRMQTTVSKERTSWCIRELDKLRAQIEAGMPPAAA